MATKKLKGLGRGLDALLGGSESDALIGGSGDDTLDGGLGADTMAGGAGNDTYLVDETGDSVSELNATGTDAGGVDQVTSTVSFTLGAYLEKLKLTGTAAINAAV